MLAAVRTVGESYDAADRGYNEAADQLSVAAPDRALGLGKLDTSCWHEVADRIERVLGFAR